MMNNLLLTIILLSYSTLSAQQKNIWEKAELVSPDGVILKTFNVKSSTTFVDSLLIVSCLDPKVLGLISKPSQALFDETNYRIYKRNNITSSYRDSVGVINRQAFFNVVYNNKIVVFVDDSLSFIMIHPTPDIGLVLHNGKNKK
jgi:hypothetical protein